MTPTDELIAALRAEAERLSGRSLQAGDVDCGIAANLAEAAADRLASLTAERDQNKRLVAVLKEADAAVENSYLLAQAEYQDHDRRADNYDAAIRSWRDRRRAALAQPEEQR